MMTRTPKAPLIHIGDSTHHHNQLITPVSLMLTLVPSLARLPGALLA
jgi:hypothetical protein